MKLPEPYARDEKIINVVIETPRGSRNKYVYHPENDFFELKKTLPFGTVFPFDFGFVPGTKAADGDPLDILILMDFPTFPGCVVKCRCLGVIIAEQTEKGKKYRNDRVICIPKDSLTFSHMKTIKDLHPNMLDEIVQFFTYYNQMAGKTFRMIQIRNEISALKIVRESVVST